MASSASGRPYDAIIVGARCAGAPCAMLLAKQGARVLLLDRDRFPSNMPLSTHLMHPLAVARLIKWGLLDEIAARSVAVTRWRLALHGVTMVGPPPPVDGNALSFAPRREFLDGVLECAAVRAGAELRETSTVTDLVFDGDQVVGIEARGPNGRKFTEHARIVIGADGPGSIVAHRTRARESHVVPLVQSNLWSYFTGITLDEVQLHVQPKMGAFAFPSSDGAVLIAANLMYDEFIAAKADRMAAYRARLRQVAPALDELVGRATPVDRLYAGCTRAFVRQAAGPGWALIGDAGIKKDPVTAQGIPSAFLTAEWLAEALGAVFSGRRAMADALSDYGAQRDSFMMPFYDFTVRLAEFNPPSDTLARLYRAIAASPAETTRLFGAVALTDNPDEVFSTANVERLIGHA